MDRSLRTACFKSILRRLRFSVSQLRLLNFLLSFWPPSRLRWVPLPYLSFAFAEQTQVREWVILLRQFMEASFGSLERAN